MRTVAKHQVDLARLGDEELLDMRFRDLGLTIEGTWLEKCIAKLHSELDNAGIRFRPPCFLADEWLCPDGEPIIGIAFFLAHPRLKRLERKMMFEVEGGDKQWCMKLLRHEAGHAINYAYLLHRRRKWRDLFGPFSEEYPDRYKYHPYSKRFVRNLDGCYAQYHPDEDFAETFAVWLHPRSGWRKKYRGWKALDKLRYVDSLMKDIGDKSPKVSSAEKHWDISKLRSTLRTHYKKKREFYAEEYPDFHDLHLRKIFSTTRGAGDTRAGRILKDHRRTIVDYVAACTGERKYIINDLLRTLGARSRELELYGDPADTNSIMCLAVYITSLTMNYLYTGRFAKEKGQGL